MITNYNLYLLHESLSNNEQPFKDTMLCEQLYLNNEYTPEIISKLEPNEIFVYGSNRQGILGGGSAYYAKKFFGAKDGIPSGMTGQCYGIYTKDYDVNIENGNMRSVPLLEIRSQIIKLYNFAKKHPDKKFLVTKIGTALAGFSMEEIVNCFTSIYGTVPKNVILPKEFVD